MSPQADTRPPAIALMGPTASGKTAVAVDWAQRFGMALISVDSAQVYRGLDIGSAKPDAATQALAPHRLIDIRDPHEAYSAAEFRTDALREMMQITRAGRIPLLVGGTGLYFHALLDGLSDMPPADPELRARLAGDAQQHGWPALHARLARVDPQAAQRIQPSDAQRIQRALEVHQLTGRPISAWQAQAPTERLPFRVLQLALVPRERAILHARIKQRLDAMLAAGFLDEVRALRRDPRLHPGLPALRSVGYRQAWEHLEGGSSPAEFRQRAIAATRQLAKRQLTWLRRRLAARWLDPQADAGELEQGIRAFLGREVR